MKATKKALVFSFFSSYPWLLIATFFSGTINSLLSLAIPISIGKYYQLAFHSHSPRGKFLDGFFKISHFNQFYLFFGALIVLKAVFTYFEKYLSGYSSERFSKDLREKLFSTQLAFLAVAYDRKPAGKFLLRYSGDLSAIQRYIMKGVIQFSIDIIFLVFAFGILVFMNLPMTLLAFGCCLIGLIFLYLLNLVVRRITIKRRNIRSEMLSFVSSRLHGILTVKAFNREPVEEGKYQTNSEKLFQLGRRYYSWVGFLNAMIPLFLYIVLLLVFYFSHRQHVLDKSHFPAHELLVFIMILLSVLPYLRRMLSVTLVWQVGNVSISKVLRILNAPVETKNEESSDKFEGGTIYIDKLSFMHVNGKKVFNAFSAVFPEKSITRLTGPQGSGKSTLFKLLIGLYPLDHGFIRIDSEELTPATLFRFRKNSSIVSDEFPLLGKTVFEAVSYSRKAAKREKALEMLREVGVDFGVDGDALLDYPVTLAGSNLSLGQRKQLLLTRALLTRKKILLLDEPFQGMDEPAKAVAVALLNRLKKKRTIVIACAEFPSTLESDLTVALPG